VHFWEKVNASFALLREHYLNKLAKNMSKTLFCFKLKVSLYFVLDVASDDYEDL